MADWARFEAPGLVILTPRDRLFGKTLLSFGKADFEQLDQAAATCAQVTPDAPQSAASGAAFA